MICAVDSSILVAALRTSETYHLESVAVLDRGGLVAHAHALAETFSALTGGRVLPRVSASQAAQLIEGGILPFISASSLSTNEYLSAMKEAEARGVRGGAIHDFLHLFTAKCNGEANAGIRPAGPNAATSTSMTQIRHLYISPGHNFFGHHGKPADAHPIFEVPRIHCLAGRGIEGDRSFDYKPGYKGQITFFAWEE